MNYVISSTSAILGFLRGHLTEEDLKEAKLLFSCSPLHVLTPGLVPMEATWANVEKSHVYGNNGSEIPIDNVDEALQSKVRRFIELIHQADDENRVRWRIGNQPEMIAVIAEREPNAQIFWSHDKWATATDYL